MDYSICPNCGKEMISGARRCPSCYYRIDRRKRTLVRITAILGIITVITALVILLINYSGTPAAIAQSQFYQESPNGIIKAIRDERIDSEPYCLVYINYTYPWDINGTAVTIYEFEFTDDRWVCINKY